MSIFKTLLADAPYVGEIGLDGSSDFKQHSAVQEEVFTDILAACGVAGGRVLSIHSRGAARRVLDILENHPQAGTPILHWFTGSTSQLKRAIALGCWFSVGPAMLGSANGRDLAAQMPLNRVLTETDGPFATVDGKVLEPSHAQLAIPTLATIWGVSTDIVAKQMAVSLAELGALTTKKSTVKLSRP